ncbi:MAG: hypothetical protein O7G30_07030, partial [Proteobacteria bacterium]|nr:hypothetical protein [Pseudomonadota bacterium]
DERGRLCRMRLEYKPTEGDHPRRYLDCEPPRGESWAGSEILGAAPLDRAGGTAPPRPHLWGYPDQATPDRSRL